MVRRRPHSRTCRSLVAPCGSRRAARWASLKPSRRSKPFSATWRPGAPSIGSSRFSPSWHRRWRSVTPSCSSVCLRSDPALRPDFAPLMTVLFGHPTGNPNSHHAALAHFEAGRLEALCTPWMPSTATLRVLQHVPRLKGMAQRLARRHFPPLAAAPTIQGRAGEWLRLAIRACGGGDERLSYAANDWLMETMAREVVRPRVTAVHAYEDCSLRQFQAGKRQCKACIYDMPIGYFGAWQESEANLYRTYADWLPDSFDRSLPARRVDQKREEVALADLVLVPSDFVARTLEFAETDAKIAVAPYGVDA